VRHIESKHKNEGNILAEVATPIVCENAEIASLKSEIKELKIKLLEKEIEILKLKI
jgi:SMC interacting uncharacterized protein involved in chromosome segregation